MERNASSNKGCQPVMSDPLSPQAVALTQRWHRLRVATIEQLLTDACAAKEVAILFSGNLELNTDCSIPRERSLLVLRVLYVGSQ